MGESVRLQVRVEGDCRGCHPCARAPAHWRGWTPLSVAVQALLPSLMPQQDERAGTGCCAPSHASDCLTWPSLAREGAQHSVSALSLAPPSQPCKTTVSLALECMTLVCGTFALSVQAHTSAPACSRSHGIAATQGYLYLEHTMPSSACQRQNRRLIRGRTCLMRFKPTYPSLSSSPQTVYGSILSYILSMLSAKWWNIACGQGAARVRGLPPPSSADNRPLPSATPGYQADSARGKRELLDCCMY